MNRSLSTRDVSSEAIAEASGVMRSYHHGESRRGLTITSDRREGEEARCARATRRSRARLGHDASSSIPQCWSVSKVVTTPHLDVEQGLFVEGYELVGSLDEVGRGSAFGPCCVGLCVVDATVGTVPTGLRDSKLLSSRTRDGLVAPIDSWALDHAVGEASAGEIDEFGLTAALRLAGYRALSQLRVAPDILILDGSYDWMSMPAQEPLTPVPYPDVRVAPVRTRVKADLTCASVAAASVLAKVYRDHLVMELAEHVPGYDLENNKGYVTASHLAALRELGPSRLHRLSWNLPTRAVS